MEDVLKIKMNKLILFIFLFVIFFQFVGADVISLNSGGDKNLIINPDTYIEGFFSGDVIVLSVCGNGILETPYEECDDGNTISGDGCSSICVTEGGGEEEEGGGGGGGAGTSTNIRVDPTEIIGHVLINSNLEENIGVTNLDNTKPVTFSVSSSGFYSDLIVSIWDDATKSWVSSLSLTIPAGGIANLKIRFSAQSFVGNYSGSIIIDGKIVKVSLIVQERLLLFDSNIIILNENYLVPQGDKLRTSVTLIPLGEKERVDVTLNYVIKDYEDRVYLTRTETVLVENLVNFKRSFDTGILPLGQYIIGLELIYSNGVAPSSAHFEVIKRSSTIFGKIVFFLINAILIILILIIVMIVLRMVKQIKVNKELEKRGLKFFEDKTKSAK